MKNWIILLLFCCSLSMMAQKERSIIREGNELYKAGKYDAANQKFDEALKINPASIEAKFNKADALYQMKKYEDAQKLYQQVADLSSDKNTKAKAYHNMGNALLKAEKYQESVDAYKKALRINPNDKDSKYNLTYALNKLKEQQNKKNEQDKKDKEKDQKKNDPQNKEGKNNDQKKKEEPQKKQAQPQQTKISKEQAEQILKSLEGEEKKLQQKLLLQKMNMKKRKVEKDW